MVVGELNHRELDRLRERRPYWWAVWLVLASWLGWTLLIVAVPLLLVFPGSTLAQVALGVLGVAVAATVGRAAAVEALLSRWLDRSRKHRTRSDIRELNRRQVYRASRRDAFAVAGALVEHLFCDWLR
ncbi:hypothetical protein [Plantactinospora sp. B5E13]|uniref:hypothetical protein n=1 Tax=unclassified Plantactinospora TaxID=2631981 RepID=UPI00325CB55C